MFNTLNYAKMLEEAGFSRVQAETSVKLLVDVMEEKLASKQDLKDLQKDLQAEMNHRFNSVEQKFDLLESRMTIKMGAMLAASIAILTAIQKLL